MLIGAENVINIYCSYKVLFRRFHVAAKIRSRHLFWERVCMSFSGHWCCCVYITGMLHTDEHTVKYWFKSVVCVDL